MYYYLTKGEAFSRLRSLDILSLLLASIVHDIEHPGVNNAFLVSTEHALAVRYNDLSPLENFHCSTAFTILSNPNLNILEGLTPEERKELRQIMTGCILTSDPARTMEVITKFEGISSEYNSQNPEHRLLFDQLLLKCADLSNAVRPFKTCKQWAEMIQQEFFIQVGLTKI